MVENFWLMSFSDLDMAAQFSTVNQSRPEEITMKEDLTTISFVGDDNFGMNLVENINKLGF